MEDMKTHRAVLGMVVTLVALAPACRGTEEGVKEDSRRNLETAERELEAAGEDSEDAAQKMGARAGEIGSDVAQGARDVGDAIGQGASELGSDVAAGKQTLDVKAALMLDRSIDSSHIDVDTDGETNTVTLSGWVRSAADKAGAEKLARAAAEGYDVINLLTLRKS
jgi:osmotically-inducible protein OsmY